MSGKFSNPSLLIIYSRNSNYLFLILSSSVVFSIYIFLKTSLFTYTASIFYFYIRIKWICWTSLFYLALLDFSCLFTEEVTGFRIICVDIILFYFTFNSYLLIFDKYKIVNILNFFFLLHHRCFLTVILYIKNKLMFLLVSMKCRILENSLKKWELNFELKKMRN